MAKPPKPMSRVFPRPGDRIRVSQNYTFVVEGRTGTVLKGRDYRVVDTRSVPVGIDRTVSLDAARHLVSGKTATLVQSKKRTAAKKADAPLPEPVPES